MVVIEPLSPACRAARAHFSRSCTNARDNGVVCDAGIVRSALPKCGLNLCIDGFPVPNVAGSGENAPVPRLDLATVNAVPHLPAAPVPAEPVATLDPPARLREIPYNYTSSRSGDRHPAARPRGLGVA